MRAVNSGDGELLAVLMHGAYRGTIDDAGETLDDARAEVAKVLAGGYGSMDWEASSVTLGEGHLASATLVVRDATKWATGEAFVAFSMTAPACKRRGLGRAGMVRALGMLAGRGEALAHLVVTRANVPAVSLYRSLGFDVVESKRHGPGKAGA